MFSENAGSDFKNTTARRIYIDAARASSNDVCGFRQCDLANTDIKNDRDQENAVPDLFRPLFNSGMF